MFHPSADYSQSRPFKIFISLLDKWEIGQPVTEVLVLDAFKAVRKVIDSEDDVEEEMTMTACTLYEAVEPDALWKQLLKTVLDDLSSNTSSCDGINMVHHILCNFHKHDEEMETIHLPIVFTALLEALNVSDFLILSRMFIKPSNIAIYNSRYFQNILSDYSRDSQTPVTATKAYSCVRAEREATIQERISRRDFSTRALCFCFRVLRVGASSIS